MLNKCVYDVNFNQQMSIACLSESSNELFISTFVSAFGGVLRRCGDARLRHCVTASLRHCVTASLRHCVRVPASSASTTSTPAALNHFRKIGSNLFSSVQSSARPVLNINAIVLKWDLLVYFLSQLQHLRPVGYYCLKMFIWFGPFNPINREVK